MPSLKYAWRSLWKTPLVTAIAALSLALGIGANVGIFSMFDAILLRPLPITRPSDLVNLEAPGPKPGATTCDQAGPCSAVFSYPMFRDLEREQQVFTGLAAHVGLRVNLSYEGQTSSTRGELVSGSYFSTLDLAPVAGRLLSPADDAALDAPRAVVLSFDYWMAQFGGARDVVGRLITVNGQPMTVVGVAPEGFTGTTRGTRPDVFVPLTMRSLIERPAAIYADRREYWLYLFGRLRPGITRVGADGALNGQYHGIITTVEAPLQKELSDETLARFNAKRVTLAPGAMGQSSLNRNASTPLLMLLSLTGIVLLIACANIANLLLAQGAARQRDMAVRLSIGASRRHLVGQLVLEACLLAAIGGGAGLLVAEGTIKGVLALLPTNDRNGLVIGLNGTVWLFAAALSMGTALLFGVFPALHSTRPNLVASLKDQAGQVSPARSARWFRSSLVSAQVALSTMLLIAAALFVRSLVNVSRVDLGIRVDRLLTFVLAPSLSGYTPDHTRVLFEQVEDGLAALPGVDGVTASVVSLLSGSDWGTGVAVEGFEAGPDTNVDASLTEVGPAFFHTLGIPLLAGREFSRDDGVRASKVAIVNRAFARKFMAGREAVGTHMNPGDGRGPLDTEIVGLAENAKYSDVKREIPPTVYVPYRQDKRLGNITFYVRTPGDPSIVERAIPGVIKRLDGQLPVDGLHTMPEIVRDNIFLDRMLTTLSMAFAGLATLLAALGLYGVLSYTVSRRTREFGLRMALGCAPWGVCRLVLGQVLRLTLIGGVLGILLALALGPALASLLFELQGRDLGAILAAAGFVTLVGFAAGLVPALRAGQVDPMRALKFE